ncbi:carbonic anhydrase family protein [Variovorax humicola]|uniref:carbonic anhydrase n=1 Tax=Variovorax humicola TaxID=1769758 RepID=A0ABU8VV58_9BURK
MKLFRFGHVLLAAILAAPAASAQKVDYDHQEAWKAMHDSAQSPIDIESARAKPADALEQQGIRLLRMRSALEAVDNGHAVEVEVKGPEAVIRGRHFVMQQFHFHVESEHTLNGKHAPLEGHFVFKATDGRLAVIAVMYREGATNALASKLLEAIGKGSKAELPATDISTLLPNSRAYYHYLGSLTTPPLTENVEWYVLKDPVALSSAQLDEFRRHYPHNNRQIQPLNDRPVTAYPGPRKSS